VGEESNTLALYGIFGDVRTASKIVKPELSGADRRPSGQLAGQPGRGDFVSI
jgi:hypothetical protein